MNKDDYKLIKSTLISVDGLPLKEQIKQVKIACNSHAELIELIIEMLTNGAEDAKQKNQDIFTSPPILDHVIAYDFEDNILKPNTQINQYSIVKKIDSGGMGVVYSAKQKYPAERLVALKLISRLHNQDQLIKETNTLAQLNHPNIATLFEIEKMPDGQLYIAMELIEGEDIIHWCNNHQYTDKQRIKIFQQLCAGITYAHEKGIIHCDIKPSNVLVTQKNKTATVKIIDFGISQHQNHMAKRDEISGTPAYLAPEVLSDKEPALADTRRDVFAMGVLLDKLLSNNNKDLKAIVNKATAADREDRYSSAENFSRDLNRYFNKKPISARKKSWMYLSVLFLRRRFILVSVTLAFIGLLVGGYIVQAKQAQAALIAQHEAEEVSTFLTDLFNVANPERRDDKIASSYDLLNKAKDKLLAIETPTLSDARFLYTIGNIYTRMDKLKDARVVVEKSLQIKKLMLTDDDADVIVGTIQLGLLYKNLNLFEQSEQQLLAAIAALKKQKHPDLSQLAYAHNHLGNLYKKTLDFDQAIQQHLLAINIRKNLEDKKNLADSYNNLGVIYREQKNFKQSSFYMDKALQLYEVEYGNSHPFVGIVKNNLSKIEEYDNRDYDKAEKYLLDALDIFQKTYGPDHYNTVVLQTNILAFYNRRMLYSKAILFYQKNSESLLASHKINQIVKSVSIMAMVYRSIEQFDQSNQLHQLSLELAAKTPVTEKYLQENLYLRYATSLEKQGKYQQSRIQLNKALQFNQQRSPDASPFQLKIKLIMAKLTFEEGRIDDAEKLFLKSIETIVHEKLYIHEYIYAYIGLSKIYTQQNKLDKSLFALNQAKQLAESINLKDRSSVGLIDYYLGMHYLSKDNKVLAKQFLDKAHTFQSRTLPQQHPDLLATEDALKRLN